MSGLMDLLNEHIGAEQVEQISAKLGANKEQTESAISMLLPTILGAVAHKADDETEVRKLQETLDSHTDGFDNLSGLVSDTTSANSRSQAFASGSNGLLDGILGGKKKTVEAGVGKASGLSGGQVGSLIGMLAPVVIGAIGKKALAGGQGSGGLAGMLRGEKKSVEKQASGGLLGRLLDQDGDGDFDFKDVMKFGMRRFFGR